MVYWNFMDKTKLLAHSRWRSIRHPTSRRFTSFLTYFAETDPSEYCFDKHESLSLSLKSLSLSEGGQPSLVTPPLYTARHIHVYPTGNIVTVGLRHVRQYVPTINHK